MSQVKGRPSEFVCFNPRTGRSPCPCSVNWYQAEVVLHDPNHVQKGVRTYVDLTTYLGPNPQVYRKVPIINPVHRFLALQHSWRPERFMKLAVGASGGVLPPHSHYKPSTEVDSRLLTINRLLRDSFWRSRQSLDFFFESRQLVKFQKKHKLLQLCRSVT